MKALWGRAANAFGAFVRFVGVGGGGAGSFGLKVEEVAALRIGFKLLPDLRLAANSRTKAGMSSDGR